MTAPGTTPSTAIPTPQVKICGITVVEDAIACVSLGADAIGLMFYPKSPRCVDARTAADICSAIRPGIARIGVFVDADHDTIMETVTRCGLTGVQLHGSEPPELSRRLLENGLLVIKALFTDRPPFLKEAEHFPLSEAGTAFLVESGTGRLPGGTGISWDWQTVRGFGQRYPMILAGGLSPTNVVGAIAEAAPAAVDVSSGVESAPGKKDYDKVRIFIQAVHALPYTKNEESRRIFK